MSWHGFRPFRTQCLMIISNKSQQRHWIKILLILPKNNKMWEHPAKDAWFTHGAALGTEVSHTGHVTSSHKGDPQDKLSRGCRAQEGHSQRPRYKFGGTTLTSSQNSVPNEVANKLPDASPSTHWPTSSCFFLRKAHTWCRFVCLKTEVCHARIYKPLSVLDGGPTVTLVPLFCPSKPSVLLMTHLLHVL